MATKTGIREMIDVKYHFDQEERNQLAYNLSRKQLEVEELENEKKARASEYKAQIDARLSEIKMTAHHINDGYMYKTVYADKYRNWALKRWEWIDPDTGEVLKTEPFIGLDYQKRLEDEVEEEGEVVDAEYTEPLLLGPPADDTTWLDPKDNNDEPQTDDPNDDDDQ